MKKFDIAWQVQVRLLAKKKMKEDLCEEVGINKRMLYLCLSGRQNFSVELVTKLAKALDCTMEDLLVDIPDLYK